MSVRLVLITELNRTLIDRLGSIKFDYSSIGKLVRSVRLVGPGYIHSTSYFRALSIVSSVVFVKPGGVN